MVYTFTRKAILAAATLLVATFASLSAATAQELLFSCGATVESSLATSSKATAITSTGFVKLNELKFPITLGTGGDCAVVTVTAQTACKGASAHDTCLIRVLDNGVAMAPVAANGAVLDSESKTPSAHTLAWVKRGPIQGNHRFTVEVRVGNVGTTFVIDNWTMHVQLFS